MVHLCLLAIQACRCCTRRPCDGRSSAFERKTAVTSAIQLDQTPHRLKRDAILLAIEHGEHPDEIAGRGDRRADSASERLARGAATQVVVAGGAGWLSNDLELPRAGRQLEHVGSRKVAVKRKRPTVRAAGLEVG